MRRENSTSCLDGQTTGMALSVLAEVGRLLEALAATGETGAIDLRSLPLTDADRAQLEDLLGHGEVHAELAVAGRSEVWETGYAGAWWIRHRGADERIATEVIAICPAPDILQAHPDDIQAAARRIRRELEVAQAPAAADLSETPLETSHV
jgi:hydrogenase-1 operon protein HyaF